MKYSKINLENYGGVDVEFPLALVADEDGARAEGFAVEIRPAAEDAAAAGEGGRGEEGTP